MGICLWIMDSAAVVQDGFSPSALLALDERLFAATEPEACIRTILAFFVPAVARGARILARDVGSGETLVRTAGPLAEGPTGVRLELRPNGEPAIGTIDLYGMASPDILDTSLGAAVVQHASCALRNALAYANEKRTALAFQHASLAPLPLLPGYRFDAVYEPGRSGALVGGDWYDAFALPDGRCVLSIGDVMGSGLEAAVAMLNVRQTMRGVAQIHADPMLMLEAADRAVHEQHPERYVTAFVAVFDPITWECSYAGAGHPPAFIRHGDGRIGCLSSHGLPLGLAAHRDRNEAGHSRLSPGALLLLYTDGLTEATHDLLEGEARVREALAEIPPDEERPAHRIRDRVLVDTAGDDVAILAVRFELSTAERCWRFDPSWKDAARRAREELREVIEGAGYRDGVTFDFIFAELCANLIYYAPGIVEFHVQVGDGALILHVVDKGPGFHFFPRLPRDLFSESGRGLYLIAALADGFTVEPRPGGGSHARVILPISGATRKGAFS